MLQLHQANGADWDHVPPENWNLWQRMAAATNGIVAPANFVSLVGAVVVCWGLYLVIQDTIIAGITAILAGRCADILDGWVADYTKTKSSLGEAIDASVDKIIIFLTLLVLVSQQLVPIWVLLALLVVSVYNASLSIYAWARKKSIHPSRIGKLTTAAAWITLLLYLLLYRLPDDRLVNLAALASFSIFVIGAVISSAGYTRQLHKAVKVNKYGT